MDFVPNWKVYRKKGRVFVQVGQVGVDLYLSFSNVRTRPIVGESATRAVIALRRVPSLFWRLVVTSGRQWSKSLHTHACNDHATNCNCLGYYMYLKRSVNRSVLNLKLGMGLFSKDIFLFFSEHFFCFCWSNKCAF